MEAKEATAAYRAALADGTAASWQRFVRACAALASHGQALESLTRLSESDRAAWRFFEQIALENADLLEARELAIA